jgi:hypothetical protein
LYGIATANLTTNNNPVVATTAGGMAIVVGLALAYGQWLAWRRRWGDS